MFKKYISESSEIHTKEDNPLYYIFIIPKLVKNDIENVKNDSVLINLINYIDENMKGLATAELKKKFNPISLMDLFSTQSVKKELKTYINQYLSILETTIANDEKDFIKAYKIHKKFADLKSSDVFSAYLKTL